MGNKPLHRSALVHVTSRQARDHRYLLSPASLGAIGLDVWRDVFNAILVYGLHIVILIVLVIVIVVIVLHATSQHLERMRQPQRSGKQHAYSLLCLDHRY